MSNTAAAFLQQQHQKTEEIRHAINSDDMKRAIKLAQKLDKNDLARAMLAFCYQRTGRRDEALELAHALHQVALTNDSVMHWLTYVYSYSRQLQSVAKLRQERLALAPAAGQAYFHAAVDCLFALAKMYDFAECDTLVKKIMAVNRNSPRPVMDVPTLSIWAATFGFLRGGEGDALQLALALAASFLDKAAQTNADTAGLPLKRWIQVRRGQFQQARDSLAFLPNESPASKLWMRALLVRLAAADNTAAAEKEEFKLLCDLVETAPDDFRAWARMCQLASASADSNKQTTLLLRQLIASKTAALPKLRGPALALVRLELELFLVQQQQQQGGGDGGLALKDAVMGFVRRFSALNHVVFSDLRNDLLVFCLPNPSTTATGATGERQTELPPAAQVCAFLLPPAEYVQRDRESRLWPCESLSQRVSPAVRQALFADLQYDAAATVQAKQILRYCGAYEHYTVDELLALVRPTVRAALVEDGEKAVADEDALFAAHVLQDAHAKSGGDGVSLLLCCAAAVLEDRMSKSADNFEVKLALHELYSVRLGAPLCGLPAYAMLRIKQIQCDALGHVSLANLANYGFFLESRQFAQAICDVNSKSRAECADSFATAFEHSQISSPVEMYRLELRLRRSLQFHLAVVERSWMSLLPTSTADADAEGDAAASPSFFSRLHVEVNNPAQGKSAVCVPEHRLAATFEHRRGRKEEQDNVLVWNADLNVEYTCDAPFGSQYVAAAAASSSSAGPNARLARELLGSGQGQAQWRARELLWADLRTEAARALINNGGGGGADEVARLVGELVLNNNNDSAAVAAVWRMGLAAIRLLASVGDGERMQQAVDAAADVERAWTTNSSEVSGFSLDFVQAVSAALSHAGLWTAAVVSRLGGAAGGAGKKKKTAAAAAATSVPFSVADFAKLQTGVGKALQRVAHVLRELQKQQNNDDDAATLTPEAAVLLERALGSTTTATSASSNLAHILSKVRHSHCESLGRLHQLAVSLGRLA